MNKPKEAPVKTPAKQGKEKEEKPVFDQPTPYGWYTVIFPPITSETRPLDLWIDELLQHLRDKGVTAFSWSFLHGMPMKKFDHVLSPVFHFKNRMDAKFVEWRFSGETLEGEGCV